MSNKIGKYWNESISDWKTIDEWLDYRAYATGWFSRHDFILRNPYPCNCDPRNETWKKLWEMGLIDSIKSVRDDGIEVEIIYDEHGIITPICRSLLEG